MKRMTHPAGLILAILAFYSPGDCDAFSFARSATDHPAVAQGSTPEETMYRAASYTHPVSGVAQRGPVSAGINPKVKKELEEAVKDLRQDDIVGLRRNSSDIIKLAEIYESEGNDEEAMELYEKALSADPANRPCQFSLARLLIRCDRWREGVSILRGIYEYAEDEELLGKTKHLLASMGAEPSSPTLPAEPQEEVEIVLVPVGYPSRRVLSELGAALRDSLGMTVSLADKIVLPGKEDRLIAPGFFFKLAWKVQEWQDELSEFLKGIGLGSDENGRGRALRQLRGGQDAEVGHKQYDCMRLTEELRLAFPLSGKGSVKCYLGVTSLDIYTGEANFLYGSSNGAYGVVSTYRFSGMHFGEEQNRPRLIARTLKQALSTVGFCLGLPRCREPYCARSVPINLVEHDAKSERLCEECAELFQTYRRNGLNRVGAREYLNRGIVLRREGKLDEAIENLQRAIAGDPNLGQAYEELGLAHARNGRKTEAFIAFSKAVELKPDSEPARIHLGLRYLEEKEYQSAIEHLLISLKTNPRSVPAHTGLGEAYHNLKDWDKAVEHLKTATELDPSFVDAHFRLGICYYSREMFEEAAKSYGKAIAIDPNMPALHYNLGLVYLKTGKKYQGAEEFRRAIALNPSLVGAHIALGEIYGRDGFLDEAIGSFEKAAAIKPDMPVAWNNLGYTRYLKKDYTEAIADFETALRLSPDNALAHYNKALAHFAGMQFAEAILHYDKAAALGYPGSPKFREALEPHR